MHACILGHSSFSVAHAAHIVLQWHMNDFLMYPPALQEIDKLDQDDQSGLGITHINFDRGVALYQLGRYKEAINAFKAAVKEK